MKGKISKVTFFTCSTISFLLLSISEVNFAATFAAVAIFSLLEIYDYEINNKE